MLNLIAELVDPTGLAESYWEASKNLMRRARDELAEGDLMQAGEKTWGVAALALKSLAYKREGLRLSSHEELWEYVSKLVEETHDEELGRLWRSVSSMHVNFYEGWATEKHVKGAIEDTESFIEKVKKLLSSIEKTYT
ncbi:MAG: PaREP1 family protein [Candidatus Bathyarchaeia archaeon]